MSRRKHSILRKRPVQKNHPAKKNRPAKMSHPEQKPSMDQVPSTEQVTPSVQKSCSPQKKWASHSGSMEVMSLLDIYNMDPKMATENSLVGSRFLYRGGIGMLAAETGVGKSSFIMQCALHWALGRECFGLPPNRALNILLIQAENDKYDLQDELMGIGEGMVTEEQLQREMVQDAIRRTKVIRTKTLKGDAFIRGLDKVLEEYPEVDLVIIDPLLAYAGCDLGSQREMTNFMRHGLDWVIGKHNVGLLLVHHTCKAACTSASSDAGSYDYYGSSEIANVIKGSLTLVRCRNCKGNVFRLVACKHANHLKLKNRVQWLKWSENGIYWEAIEPESQPEKDAKEGDAPETEFTMDKVSELISALEPARNYCKAQLLEIMESRLGLKGSRMQDNLLEKCLVSGKLRRHDATKAEKKSCQEFQKVKLLYKLVVPDTKIA